jgi:acyl-CoA synthetase (AMP-forming)/AMP-acid ligase II
MNIGTIIDAAATGDPERIALIIGNRAVGYGQLASAVERCAAGLAANGVVAGNRVAVVDAGSLLSIAAVIGAAR